MKPWSLRVLVVATCMLTWVRESVLGGSMTEITPEVLISEEQIHNKVVELAARLSADYADVDDLILVGILKGSFIFLSDLSRALTIPRSIDFMALSTYGDAEATDTDGAVRMIMDLRRNITGKLDITNIAELTKFAIREGLTTLDT